GQHVSLAQVQTMLGVADPRAIQKFILHIANLDSAAGLHLIHELVEAGADLRQVNLQVAEYWRAMMLEKAGADIATIIDGTEDEVKEIKQAAQLFTLEELTACARIFAQNDLVQKNQGTPQLGLELALLACLELHRREQSGQPVQPVQPVQTVQTVPPIPTPVQARPAPMRAPIEPVQVPQPTERHDAPLPAPVPSQEAAVDALPDWDELPADDEEFEPVPQAAPVESSIQIEAPVPQEEAGPALTVADVKERWEYVKRRVKTVKSGAGARIAAVLNGYSIVGVEGTRERPVVILMANATFHYTALQKKEDHDSIEWALKVELQRECSVRLLPPGSGSSSKTIPPPNASNYAAHAAVTLPPLQSAHVERPAAPPVRATPPPQEQLKPAQKQEPPTSRGPSAPIVDASFTSPLARNGVVRENTDSTPGEKAAQHSEQHITRLQSAAKKVKGDPIVQEVARMFKAEIKDIQLK
ncbi:MAG TPA: hypothetical protein VGT82_02795, partial [Ktedonobacteraceae bacterium]|nr:hypothetical protein [Ktedonobacteraceae bacterium]